jgi:hypothetical protein
VLDDLEYIKQTSIYEILARKIIKIFPTPPQAVFVPYEEYDLSNHIKEYPSIFSLLYARFYFGVCNDLTNRIEGKMDKPFYTSKTIWFNLLALAWQFIGSWVGIPVLSPELFAEILAAVNLVLRLITKGGVTIA